MQNQKTLYKNLAAAIVEIFGSKQLFGEETEELQTSLTKGIQETLLIALDYNYNEEELDKLQKELDTPGTNELIAITKYVERSLENKASYIIINKFFIETILKTAALFDDMRIDLIEQVLDKHNVSLASMRDAEMDWQNFVQENEQDNAK